MSVTPMNGGYSATLKFSPNQPKSDTNADLCSVSQYSIFSRLRNGGGGWVCVTTRKLEASGFLNDEENVIIPLHLVTGHQYCDYEVAMEYCNAGEVKSNVFSPETALNTICECI